MESMKRPKATNILDDEEVELLTNLVMAALPSGAQKLILSGHSNPEDTIRMRSLGATFKEARESSNECLKDTSLKTKIPQYRIRAVENGNVSHIKPVFLRSLSLHFRLDEWCSRWSSKNRELAERLGMLEWLSIRKTAGRQANKGFSESELTKITELVESFVESRRPPQHIRSELDTCYRITGQSFEIFEIRPRWRQPEEIQEISVAKATYVKSRKVWKLYWMRADLKWHRYTPLPDTKSLQHVLKEIGEDPYCCFWG